ncbi:MAG: carbonic anhydrase [Stackebrandtia sp.]
MRHSQLRRRALLAGAGAAAIGVTGGASLALTSDATATAEDDTDDESALTPIERLLKGNRRFATQHARHPHQSIDYLHQLAEGQHPFAVTVGCSDSRVPPEILFDQGLGDIFDQRVAGNLVDDVIIGSIEFAVEEFTSPVLMVLGHERCGAITATVEAIESGLEPPGHIAAIVDALRPVVEPVLEEPGDPVENGVRAHVRHVVTQIQELSGIVAEHVMHGDLKVYGARYDIDDGKVELLDLELLTLSRFLLRVHQAATACEAPSPPGGRSQRKRTKSGALNRAAPPWQG